MGKFIVDGTALECPMGSSGGSLTVSDGTIKGDGKAMANIQDAIPMANIPSFGTCSITACPCVPATSSWTSSLGVKVRGAPAVDDSCTAVCPIGGVVSVSDPCQESVNS